MGFGKSYGELVLSMAKLTVTNKKGVEGAGFSWIIAIIVLILSAGVILWVLQASSAKADEKTQVDLCRVSNEIKVGLEHRTSEYVSTPRFCNTVDKTSGKARVPTKSYHQKNDLEHPEKDGVALETRDILKNCWYMWLEGSEPNIFRLFPGEQQCSICYNFKIKDGLNLNMEGLRSVLNGPYFASDTSDKCNPPNGGFLRSNKDTCDGNTDEVYTGKPVGSKFCCRKDLINECYNKGGQCLESSSPPYESKYDKWACPSEKTCYAKQDNMVTYMEYIIESNAVKGKPAGDLFVEDISSTSSAKDLHYPPDKKYAISFMSPSKDCGWWANKCWDAKVDAFVYQLGPGLIETWGRHNVESYTDDLGQKPSVLMLSSYEMAQKMGCKEE